MKRFGYLFTSHVATIIILALIVIGEGGTGLWLGWSKEWADQIRLINSILSLIFLVLLHNRSYRGAQKKVEDDEAERGP